ncbi:carbohydrate kinase [Polaribacter sp. MSW13]|uniref:Carbohydrate kinase n=1 Tax=Polaribacter marinus TaxID=2916838 RepID=A0A9X1VPC6_9FLAO|nr:FGGY family carbohydrate kinase [Polaribacter marinus]MCI2229850.1 carbohydrate kinase [Polaribacter marinus]
MDALLKQKVIAVFDIGKTNKKFFLFDTKYREVYKEYITLTEIVDEDGFPTEDIYALQNWMKSLFDTMLLSDKFEITAVNFSTYGASFIHLDENGKILTPLYNYLKPIPSTILDDFESTYGDISVETGSPKSAMLNSGMQLYWIKKSNPEVYKKIKYSLHLPQYLSYLFTGIPLNEYTSLGCHTALWDYQNKDYHSWVYQEEIHKILPPIVSAETSIHKVYNGKPIKIGVGIHDSSSALIPYMRSYKKPFILVSTGTWSVSLNPYSKSLLTKADLLNNTINYMKVNGEAVKSSKLLLGKEYQYQVNLLSNYFKVPSDFHKLVKFDDKIFKNIENNFADCFRWEYLSNQKKPIKTTITQTNFQEAYHQLMMELVQLQIKNIEASKGVNKSIKNIFIDGGFSDNDVFIQLLTYYLKDLKVWSTNSSLGSSLGAAIVISNKKLGAKFLKKKYVLKKHIPFILK